MAKFPNQERYTRRQRKDRGLVKVAVWVPEAARDRVIEMAANLRRLAKRRRQHDD